MITFQFLSIIEKLSFVKLDPQCISTLLLMILILRNLNLHYLRLLSIKLQLFSTYSYVKIWPPLGGNDFLNFESTLPKDASTLVSAFLADLFLRRRYLKIYSIYSYIKNSTLHCGHTPTQRVVIFTTLNLHYLRMLTHKFELFWPNCSWEENLWKFLKFFPYFLIISPCKMAWSLIFITFNPIA